MEIIKLVLHPLATNSYIVRTSEDSAVMIDPADDPAAINEALAERGMTLTKILLTHGHFDHTGAVKELSEGGNIPVYIHSSDVELLTDATKALAFFCPQKPFTAVTENIHTFAGGDVINDGGVSFTVMHTPGHTAGSVCFLTKDDDGSNIMFAGDTIFRDSIGRCDGYSGDYIVQQETLDKLRSLEEDYVIYPGHGPSTTLFEEKRYNPFIADL